MLCGRRFFIRSGGIVQTRKLHVCLASGRSLGGASHRMQLPLDQAAGGTFDCGVRDLQHELGELFGRKRGHVLFLGLLDCSDAAERVGEDQVGVWT